MRAGAHRPGEARRLGTGLFVHLFYHLSKKDETVYLEVGETGELLKSGGESGTDLYCYGTDEDDVMTGDSGMNYMRGARGDKMRALGGHDDFGGESGDDRMFGGDGRDDIVGSGGRDLFSGRTG